MMNPVSQVDAFVQKHFDAAVHALMRRFGLSKRTIRRNAWGASIAGQFADCVLTWSSAGRTAFGFTLGFLLMVALGASMWVDDLSDANAEASPGTASAADGRPRSLFFKGYGWAWIISRFVAGRFGLDLVGPVGFLVQGYLGRTPPKVPPKKEKEREAPPLAAAVHS